MTKKELGLRTIVYVDGYNLYYSALTKSPYKWLDLCELLERHVIHTIEPTSQVERIKFFTAPILGKLASDPDSPNRQTCYHNALKAHNPEIIEIITGYHTPVTKKAQVASPISEAPEIDIIEVITMEEKQTDVNISVHMYRDCVRNECDQVVLVSNDSDLELVLKYIKQDFPHINIGLVLPGKNRLSQRLQQHAKWTRKGLREEALLASQLPEKVTNRKHRTFRKPTKWSDEND